MTLGEKNKNSRDVNNYCQTGRIERQGAHNGGEETTTTATTTLFADKDVQV